MTPSAQPSSALRAVRPEARPFRIRDRFKSFRYAAAGIVTMLRSQHNAWLHAVATLAVTALGIAFHLSRFEWCWIVLAMMAVWTAEALNTAFEFLADVASPEFHPMVKCSKDVSAGAVLLSAIGAAFIGSIIFWPHVISLLHRT
jgi:diacylglycerol kinase (ATP)